ncbi:MAG TPA: hypothetical protein VFZ65_08540 [Planctomycetota bacterium]|nr:hypothetical protein [Planctomycetota bacterium]
MRRSPSSAGLAGLLLAGAAAAQSACLDQSYVPAALTNGLEVTANQPVTQTFTVGRTGQLVQVEISRINHHNGVSGNPLQIDIVATDATGTPTTTSLASVTVPPAGISNAIGPLRIDLSAFGVAVTAGQVLGLALTSPNAPGTPSYAWWGEAPGGSYANGQVFIQGTLGLSVWDLAFQTWVSVPASWQGYGAGHPGTNGIPGLTSSANPVLGTTPDVLVGNSAGAPTIGALFFGLARVNVPTPFGGNALLVPIASLGFVAPLAGAQLPFALPMDGALCGFVIDMQAVLVDGGASAGISFTPGLEYVLGD